MLQTIDGGTALAQFGLQPGPFIAQLFVADEQALRARNARELGPIEVVAAGRRLRVDVREVGIDRRARRDAQPKPFELRMMPCRVRPITAS